jgi:DNA-binding IclR family transcriptional regulator
MEILPQRGRLRRAWPRLNIQDEYMYPYPEPAEAAAPRGAQTLARGLKILRILVDSNGPVTATELAARTGTHQSTASRLLSALIAEGYVKKVGARGFTVDAGVLALAAGATRTFMLNRATEEELVNICERAPGLVIVFAALWEDTLVFLRRRQAGQETLPFSVSAFPLHLSCPGLRLLIDRPEKSALATLAASRAKLGWGRPTQNVPETARELLTSVREHVHDGVLVLDDWQAEGRRNTAAVLEAPWGPAALSTSGPIRASNRASLVQFVSESARTLEHTLSQG